MRVKEKLMRGFIDVKKDIYNFNEENGNLSRKIGYNHVSVVKYMLKRNTVLIFSICCYTDLTINPDKSPENSKKKKFGISFNLY